MEARQEVAHIDELLKIESGSKVKIRRNARHQMTARIGKAAKKAVNSERNARQVGARKWGGNGETTVARWLSSSISKRDDRKENPDRDQDDSYIAKS